MWSLNNLANKAAEAISSAKKGISEMAKEVPQELVQEKKQEPTIGMLKNQCMKYRKELEKQLEVISEYKKIVQELSEQQKQQEGKLLAFRIVIGRQDEQDKQEEIEESNQRIVDMESLLEKTKGELESIKRLSLENTENWKKELQVYQEEHAENMKKIKALDEQSLGHQEGLFKYKQRIQKNIGDCYDMLKGSFDVVGLKIPILKPEQLGVEDIQEFIYTQSRFIEDTIKSLNIICAGFNRKAENLDDLKSIVAEALNESSTKSKAAQETAKNAEANSIKVMKEKEDLHRLIVKKDEKIKVLSDELKKIVEETKNFEEIKENNSKLVQKIKMLVEQKESLEKNIMDINENSKKIKENCAALTETNGNLNKRLKYVNSTVTDKENHIKSLQEQLSLLKSEFCDLETNFEDYKSASEKNLSEVNDYYIAKIQESTDSFSNQINSLKSQLSKAQNEAKDSNIAKIQSSKYQQAVEKLQDIVKNLETQNSGHISKIDKLTGQIDKNSISLKRKKEKLKKFKELAANLQSELDSIRQEFELEREVLTNKAKESELVKHEAENLLKRIETQIQASDSMIDKRIISTFLLNYLNEKNNHKTKIQMLKALAEMLGLTHEQRLKIGLGQEVGLFSHLSSYISRA